MIRTAPRPELAPFEVVDLLPLDDELCLLPGPQPRSLVCEPYAQLFFKSDGDLRHAAAAIVPGPALAIDPRDCSRPIRLDVTLAPLLGRLRGENPTSVLVAITLEIATPPGEQRWEWAAILCRDATGGQAFLKKLPQPLPAVAATSERLVLEAMFDREQLARPGLSFAIQWGAGMAPLELSAVRMEVQALLYRDHGRRAATLAADVVVEVFPSLTDQTAARIPLNASADEVGGILDAPGFGGDPLYLVVHDAEGLAAKHRVMRGQLAGLLARLARDRTAPPATVADRLTRVRMERRRGNYLASLAEIDAIDDPGGGTLDIVCERMMALSALSRFEAAMDVFEAAAPALRAATPARLRYIEAAASAGRPECAVAVMRSAIAEEGPKAIEALAALYRYACFLPPPDRRAMASRIVAEPNARGSVSALTRIAHDRIADGDPAGAELALAALRSGPGGQRAAMEGAIAEAQLAFAQGRYAAEARAFNAALATQNLPPISLRSVDEPLTAANVDAAPTRRDATGPLVSVLMTTYNSEATIGWSVASVLAQSHANIELIVVDDASRDRTFAVLSAMAQADPRLRIERMPENAGTYVARNTGMRLAGGALVTCQDADDWAHPEKIAMMVARLAAEPDLVATGVHHVRVSGERGFQCRSGQYTRPDASSLMFRREPVIDRIGYFDSVRSGADSEFTRRLQRVFGPAALSYCAELLSVVSWSPTTLSGGGRFAIDDDTGVMAPLRNAYRASYTVWHETASGDLYLPFPLAERPFAVPDEMMRRAAPSAQGAGMPTEP